MDIDSVSIVVTANLDAAPIEFTEGECFICRETAKKGQEQLLHFCDCTDLAGHHQCLLTWIQKGSGNENRQQCSACTAKYQLQEGSVWKKLVCQWKNLLVGLLIMVAIIATPISVQYMKTLTDPAPTQVFKVVAVCAGIIAETLLLKLGLQFQYGQNLGEILSEVPGCPEQLEEFRSQQKYI
ncbi:uncharacterized protein [Engystomops pustulosus]|uniref:uncharacterized protein isoform X2 n=1 Tax=Engystomops pustulosus TaxID=76066 RepID=UPI003AFA238E